jgi:hypothetical protein
LGKSLFSDKVDRWFPQKRATLIDAFAAESDSRRDRNNLDSACEHFVGQRVGCLCRERDAPLPARPWASSFWQQASREWVIAQKASFRRGRSFAPSVAHAFAFLVARK